MGCENANLTWYALRLVENAELSQYRAAVVVNSFPGQTIMGVKRVHPAKRELDSSTCRWKTPPFPEVSSANHDFDNNGFVRDMAALYVDFQVRQRFHKLLVESADPAPALIMFAPGLIVVPCRLAESAENSFKVMLVLESNMLFNNCDTG